MPRKTQQEPEFVTSRELYSELKEIRSEATRIKIGVGILFALNGVGVWKMFGSPAPAPSEAVSFALRVVPFL